MTETTATGTTAGRRVLIRPLAEPGDLGWVIQAHGETYWQEYGWDASFEALVAKIAAAYAADHDADREAAWIAEVDGMRAGSVFCVAADQAADPAVAKLRLLLTLPSARGLGIGTELVRLCMDFARRADYQRMQLWTNDVLVAARRIYLAAGFTLVSEEPHHSWGADLVSQTYEADLARRAAGDPP
jgi:GNAT superfamily N-acetyltransferase